MIIAKILIRCWEIICYSRFYNNMGRIPNKKKFKLAKSSMSSIINYDLEAESKIYNTNNSQASRSSDVLPVIKQVYLVLLFLT